MKKNKSLPAVLLAAILTVSAATAPLRAAPVLVPGVWTQIGPPEASLGYGCLAMVIDPNDPLTLYIATAQQGLWKSTDGGSNWTRLGDPSLIGFPTTGYLDAPNYLLVDPGDSSHLYATDGVAGTTLGFWVSRDGGTTWTMPAGFANLTGVTRDVTAFSVDPLDFNHIILSSHAIWPGLANAGIFESRDGGTTWTIHQPVATWVWGTQGIHFLYDPASGQGDSNTWLVANDGDGLWRTTTAGRVGGTAAQNYLDGTTSPAAWTRVSTLNCPHGGNQIYYTASGVLYAGASPFLGRSIDNGATWQSVNTVPFGYYQGVGGDGTRLYTNHSYPILGGLGNQSFYTSLESDGLNWTPYQSGAQVYTNGPFRLAYDRVNGIMYAAMWENGVLALKVTSSPASLPPPPAGPKGLRVR